MPTSPNDFVNHDPDSLASKLKQMRKGTDLSQAKVAEMAGLAAGSYRDMEQGRVGPNGPSLTSLLRLADFYKVSLDWLVGRISTHDQLESGQLIVDLSVVDEVLKASTVKALDSLKPAKRDVLWAFEVPNAFEIVLRNSAEHLKVKKKLQEAMRRLGVGKKHHGESIDG